MNVHTMAGAYIITVIIIAMYQSSVTTVSTAHLLTIGLLFTCFVTRDADTLIRAFKVYLRPILEYTSNIWSPTQIGLIDKLELVQRRFTKRIPGFESLLYSERLSLLDLESLELRRLPADLITTYLNWLDINSNFFVFRDNSVTRGHPYKVMLGHCDYSLISQLTVRIYDPFYTLETMQGPVCLLNRRTVFILYLICLLYTSPSPRD